MSQSGGVDIALGVHDESSLSFAAWTIHTLLAMTIGHSVCDVGLRLKHLCWQCCAGCLGILSYSAHDLFSDHGPSSSTVSHES